jgi:ubiquinone/menaquinone biosynthesis C-methylase UbiE
MINYDSTPEDFYDQQTNSMNLLRSWFHTSRNKRVGSLVKFFFEPPFTVVDLGCGNVLWNEDKIPVIGVDLNEKSLDYNMSKGRLFKKIVAKSDHTSLPDNSADIVIIAEVLEHIDDLDAQLQEIFRILKPGGRVIATVPYDTNFSFWKPLFAVQCFYRGHILGEDYYRQSCGHINHFAPKSIANIFTNHGFKIARQINHYFFTIFTVATK